MAGPVGRHGVSPETGYPVMLRAFVKQVTPTSLVEDAHQVFSADVIGPAHGGIDFLNHIFALYIVKIAVSHNDL